MKLANITPLFTLSALSPSLLTGILAVSMTSCANVGDQVIPSLIDEGEDASIADEPLGEPTCDVLPAIDRDLPERIETATFAFG
jgi:hypothetical protein